MAKRTWVVGGVVFQPASHKGAAEIVLLKNKGGRRWHSAYRWLTDMSWHEGHIIETAAEWAIGVKLMLLGAAGVKADG